MTTEASDGETGPLPDLHEGLLDAATLDQLFRDLAACAEILEIIPKHAERRPVTEPTRRLTLDEAREMLLSGAARGVQIRYRHDGAQWWDTLLRMPQGIRLVRIRHDFPEAENR